MNSYIANPGFFAQTGRHSKAQKILKILEEQGKKKDLSFKLLDIGTGNGDIAFYLSQYFDVTSVDIIDQHSQHENFSFFQIKNEYLPFPDNSFDIILSNHVIEHLHNQDLHLSEMARTLKPDGLIYLATPNRLWPWEVHYHIPLLHYLPQQVFLLLLKITGKYSEDVRLLSWHTLNNKIKNYLSATIVSDAVCKWPRNYYISVNNLANNILSKIPLKLYRFLTFIHPTLIVILRKK